MADIVEVVLGTAASLLIGSTRSIGGLIPDIVVQEVARDTTFITNHPVERGAAISDHAFLMPVEVEMRCAWSDSTGGYQGYARDMYQRMQDLQQAREPFSVVTGKRAYSNMLIAGLELTTDETSEYVALIRVLLREVIITYTQASQIAGGQAATQANPARTSSTSSAGAKQPVATGAIPVQIP